MPAVRLAGPACAAVLIAAALSVASSWTASVRLALFALDGLLIGLLAHRYRAAITRGHRRDAALEQLARYREAYFRLSESLARAATLEEVLHACLPAIAQPLEWNLGAVWLIDDDRLSCRAVWGDHAAAAAAFTRAADGVRLRPGESLAGEAWHRQGLIWREDIRTWQGHRQIAVASEAGLVAAVAVPIRDNRRTLGIIEFFASQIRAPNSEQAQTFQASATQLGQLLARLEAEHQARAAMDELRRSNAELEQFAYVASHDLQEPLRAIAGFVQLLQRRYRGQIDERADRYIEHTVEGVTRVQALIDDLLTYSRAGRGDMDATTVDLGRVVHRVLHSLDTIITDSHARVTVDSLPQVVGDETRLTQVFQNLISNAMKFRNGRAPEVTVSGQERGGEWVFAVTDNGIGIPPEQSERVFRMFQRLQKRGDYPGTGIGLAVCKRIVEAHGGRIWFEPAQRGGTVFRFTLPRGAHA